MTDSTFYLSLSSPTGEVYAGPAWQISASNPTGAFAVRAHHESLMASLVSGTLEVAETRQNRKTYQIRGGVFSFHENSCVVVVDIAETEKGRGGRRRMILRSSRIQL